VPDIFPGFRLAGKQAFQSGDAAILDAPWRADPKIRLKNAG
jgi:hypothetical protein